MTNLTIKSFAEEIKISVNSLLQQFADAGINKTEIDFVNQQEKELLLMHLNYNKDNKFNKLILQRKMHSVLNISNINGKNKLVQIEIRTKRTYDHNTLIIDQDLKNNKDLPSYKKDKSLQSKNQEQTNLNNDNWDKKIKNKLLNNNTFSQDKTQFLTKLVKTNKENNLSNTTILKSKTTKDIEKTIHNKVIYEKTKQTLKDILLNDNCNDIQNQINSNISNRYLTNSNQINKTDEENNRKINNERKLKIRGNKIIKQKKNNRLFDSKIEYEETRIILPNRIRTKNKQSLVAQNFKKPIKVISRNIIIGETISVAELANKMAVKSSQVIKIIMKFGTMITINQLIDQKTAKLVAEDMGHKVILRYKNELENSLIKNNLSINCNSTVAEPRAPIVTIMGHVDHGKTSLLDYIRSTKVANSEAGGITQCIGAYHVDTNNGMITFFDTPGHAAFTAMRARGAQITDIIVLVIAADDGIMPQTIEAIQYAKDAKVPIIVAINKIDKLNININQIKNSLTKYDIISEEWGGEHQFVNVSAKTGIGINDLLDTILLQAEILELKAVRSGMANGVVIESFLDKGRGPVATVLIREGTLSRGDIVLCGLEYGRIRAMRNEIGQDIENASPSIPVEIFGLSGVPIAGDKLTVVRDEKKAREVAIYRKNIHKENKLINQQNTKFEDIFNSMTEKKIVVLNVILKSDIQGSVEAISNALEKLSTDSNTVKIKIISSGIGGINETDAVLAITSKAILLGFNVRPDASARRIIESENLDIRYYSVIYNLINEIKQIMINMFTPEYKQKIIGIAEVRELFNSLKIGTIAGCIVTEGIIKRNSKIYILRENTVIYEGELESLRRFKDDINEVRSDMECGISIKKFSNIRIGDIIKAFEYIEIRKDCLK